MIIYYHNDADGRCAAAIVLLTRSSTAHLIEKPYNKPFIYDGIKKNDDVWLVDLAISPDELDEICKRAQNVYWFDHHKSTAEQNFQNYTNLRRFFALDRCGAMLVWDYCLPYKSYPRALKLIDDYDRWVFGLDDKTNEFRFGLETMNHDPDQEIWDQLLFGCFEPDPVDIVIKYGEVAISYRDSITKNYRINFGFDAVLDGVKCFCINFYGIGSQAFQEKIKEYDLCVGFVYDGNKYTYGLYSEKIDVSVIARRHGGGGHKGAAGFTDSKYLL